MKKTIIYCIVFSLILFSCKKEKKEKEPEPTPIDPYASQKKQVKELYANMAFAVYDDSYLGAVTLKKKIDDFVLNPTASNFQLCKQAWLDVREIYGLTETFRFADGPIDNPADGPEGFINAWPMDEAYVDYVQGNANSGIINNVTKYPNIDQATLLIANENGGEKNIALGFHAIEFLLWGQDLSTTGPGARPYTDYLTNGGTASNQGRRAQYLQVTATILVAGLKQVRDAWDPAISNNYRPTFLAFSDSSALRRMFNSIKILSGFELAGERIFTAYDNMDQEDEHSCFSDNTHRDIILNAKGMDNLYKGTYTRTNSTVVSGFALKDLVALYSASKNTDVLNALQITETKVNAIYIPFDQAILLPAERPKVLEAINALKDQEMKIRNAAASVGVMLP